MIGAIYDLSRGDGRSKLFANWGRYHLYIASNTNIRLAGAELFTEDWYTMPAGHVTSPTRRSVDQSRRQLARGQRVRQRLGAGCPHDQVRDRRPDVPGRDLHRLRAAMVGDNWSVGVRGTHREFGEIIEDITIDAALVAQGLADPGAFEYRLVNPGTDFDGFFDPDHDGENLIPVAVSAGELGYPDAQRDYYALEFTFNRRFADNWMLQGSYTLVAQLRELRGLRPLRQRSGRRRYHHAVRLRRPARQRLRAICRTTAAYNVKVYGAYQWDNGLMVGCGVSPYA